MANNNQDAYNQLVWGGDLANKQSADIADAMTLGLAGINNSAGREGAVNVEAGVPDLRFGSQGYVAPGYSGDFNPQQYGPAATADASLASDSAEGRAAQLGALQQLASAGDQSANSTAALGRYQAGIDAAQFANAREQSIRQQAMATGQIGGPADMISRMQAAQGGANMDLNEGLQSAQQAALQRLAGAQAYGQAAGQMRGQDQSLAFANQNAINQFNMYNNQNQNAINQANTQLGNNAALTNLGNRQTFLNNQANAANMNVSRGDQNAIATQGAAQTKANALGNTMMGAANGQATQDANNRDSAMKILQLFSKAGGAGAA